MLKYQGINGRFLSRLAMLCLILMNIWIFVTPVWAQRAVIVRPSRISPDTRIVHVEPMLAGIRLNATSAAAQEILGANLQIERLGNSPNALLSISNAVNGISVIVGDDGVGVIFITRRGVGVLDTIQVGDLRTDAVSRWGTPAAAGEHGALWLTDTGIISVSFDANGVINRLGIGQ